MPGEEILRPMAALQQVKPAKPQSPFSLPVFLTADFSACPPPMPRNLDIAPSGIPIVTESARLFTCRVSALRIQNKQRDPTQASEKTAEACFFMISLLFKFAPRFTKSVKYTIIF